MVARHRRPHDLSPAHHRASNARLQLCQQSCGFLSHPNSGEDAPGMSRLSSYVFAADQALTEVNIGNFANGSVAFLEPDFSETGYFDADQGEG